MVAGGVIAARLLGPEDRGYLALLVLVPLIVAKVGGLGIPLAVAFYVARDREATAGIWAALRPVVMFQSGLLAGVHLLALWALLIDEPRYVTNAARYTVLLVPALLAQDYGLALLQGRGRFTAFNVLRLAPIVIYAAGVTVLLEMGLDGLSDIAAVWAGANVVLGILTIGVALSGIGPRSEPEFVPPVKDMMAFGARRLLGADSAIEYYGVDQAVVGLFVSPTALGLYSVGPAFTSLPGSIANSLGVVAYPRLAEHRDPAEARRQLMRFFVATVVLCAVVVAALEVTADSLVPFLFGDAFRESVPIARILLVSALLIAARRILSDGARGLGLPTLGMLAEAVSLVTLIPALVVYLPLWGTEGVAFSLVVAGVAGLVVMLVGLARASREQTTSGG
jgi:O-antigen/teichoic acid export membrane protein